MVTALKCHLFFKKTHKNIYHLSQSHHRRLVLQMVINPTVKARNLPLLKSEAPIIERLFPKSPFAC
jgi:hypothetical protein